MLKGLNLCHQAASLKQFLMANEQAKISKVAVYGYLPGDVTCSKKQAVFQKQSLMKARIFVKQFIFKDKTLDMFFKPNGDCFDHNFEIFSY